MWAKLGRAEELLNRLNEEVDAWHKFKPYSFPTERNDESTCYKIIARINREPDLVRWSLMISDIFHNLRCVLDHLVWAIILHENNGLVPRDAEKVCFPIWDSAPNSNARRGISLLSSEVRTAIDFMQPYNRASRLGTPVHPLSFLRDFDNSNKHRLLYLTMSAVAMAHIRFEYYCQNETDIPKVELTRSEIKDGIPILTATFAIPHPEVKHRFDTSMIIAIMYGKPNAAGADRDDYCALIEGLTQEVRDVIGAVAAVVK
jgi:hypothetical protein